MEVQINSEIHLRPRFKMNFTESQDVLISRFKKELNGKDCKYCSKIVDGHIVIDVPIDENHFWSPQLNIEIEKNDSEETIVKGLFGPKPQLWTLFMFFHFAMAVAFIGFSIMAYVQWTLKEDYSTALIVVVALPILWVTMYVLGRIGRRKGHKQMDELYKFMMKTLEKN
ncbi:GTP-binding protein [Lutibacter sp. A80]|uniref:GTP-binding protein n=1 Tax=Lutibacter sp. A80 TaxID=2918453 RepID=UPI001F062982|nr:GTP-binding protein [Lutibacter sp. A80]UMB59886.1 GTP-binding protein [Lutibacter sp. A80]